MKMPRRVFGYLNREPAATLSTTAGIRPIRLKPLRKVVARCADWRPARKSGHEHRAEQGLLVRPTSEMFSGSFRAGTSLPEWSPRPSAAALGTRNHEVTTASIMAKRLTPAPPPSACHIQVNGLRRRVCAVLHSQDPSRSAARRYFYIVCQN